MKDDIGITSTKDNFSSWFTEIILKADLADYTKVSGCLVFKPASYTIWEKLVKIIDTEFKKIGIKNAYFPMFIPESLLSKEKDHIKGFTPEVAWVTHAGNKKLDEKLAIRPTSEAIIYDSYSKWIRSHRDLPLKLNLWNSVVRWEFKHPVPFLRTREFLWQEGHNAYSNSKELEKDKEIILKIYMDFLKDYMALPGIIGRKTDKEKFAGAINTYAIELLMPNGKAIQGPDYHDDGQNFAKAYNIQFLDKSGKKQFVYQSTYAITTRMLGIMFAVHSDNKGLIIPPNMAETQIVIVPIIPMKSDKNTILNKAEEIKNQLSNYNIHIDNRDEYTPGYKFNEWELKGIPLRIEIGPRDIKNNSVVLVRRDNNEKNNINISKLDSAIKSTLSKIQTSLYNIALKYQKDNTISVKNTKELKEGISNNKLVKACWDGTEVSEDYIKDNTGGAKIICILDEKTKSNDKCVHSNKKAKYVVLIAKSY